MDLQPVRNAFLSRYPGLIDTFRELNKEIKEELRIPHLVKKCEKQVSKQELINYLDTLPLKYAYFHLNLVVEKDHERCDLKSKLITFHPTFATNQSFGGLESDYESTTIISNGSTKTFFLNNGNPGSAGLSYNRQNAISKLKETVRYHDAAEKYKDQDFFVDIKSYYEIISKRLACYEIDPNYAKNNTKAYFVDTMSKLYNDNFEDVRQESINLVDLYLFINAYILNIEYPEILNYKKILNYDKFMSETKDVRQKLIDNIYSSLDRL
jgi:hypothetical protein